MLYSVEFVVTSAWFWKKICVYLASQSSSSQPVCRENFEIENGLMVYACMRLIQRGRF